MAESDETESLKPAEPVAEEVSEVTVDDEAEASVVESEPPPLPESEGVASVNMQSKEVDWEGIPIALLLDRIKAEMGHLAVELIVAKLKSDLEHDAKGEVMNLVDMLAARVSALESVSKGGGVVDATQAAALRPVKTAKHRSRKGKK